MAEDVDLMIERMDEQINNVTKAHREELEEIEVSAFSLLDHVCVNVCVCVCVCVSVCVCE